MAFEGLICPKCSSQLDEVQLAKNLSCPHCNTKFHNKKYIEDDTYNQFIQQQKKQIEDYIRFGPKKRTTQYL